MRITIPCYCAQVLFILVTSMTTQSCEQKSTVELVESSSSDLSPRQKIMVKKATVDDDATLGCDDDPSNCTILVGTVVTPAIIAAIDNSINAGPSSIGRLFTSSEGVQNFVAGLSSLELKKLQSGNYYLQKTHDDENFVSYIAGSTSNLSMKNLEFGFQIMK